MQIVYISIYQLKMINNVFMLEHKIFFDRLYYSVYFNKLYRYIYSILYNLFIYSIEFVDNIECLCNIEFTYNILYCIIYYI